VFGLALSNLVRLAIGLLGDPVAIRWTTRGIATAFGIAARGLWA